MSAAPISITSQLPSLPAPARRRVGWQLLVAWGALGLMLAVELPVFLCMGLDCDTCFYDLIARRVMAGQTHYRDTLDTNLPGPVWLHMLFRSIVGWSSEALRAVDFAIAACSVWLLTNMLPRSMPDWGRVATGGALLTFYLSTSEWCHCQRDPWMLLPCLVALRLRGRQSDRLAEGDSSGLFRWAFVEGIIWGAAFWIKPFVAVPALACWIVSAWPSLGMPGTRKRMGLDFIGLLSGGLMIGGTGVVWLVATGAWADFVDIMFRWNAEYYQFKFVDGPWWAAPLGTALRLFPWVFVHLVAIPIAIVAVWRGTLVRGAVSRLFATFYLAWLFQSAVLQHSWDYVHVPSILLGIVVLVTRVCGPRGGGRTAAIAFLVGAASWSTVVVAVQIAPTWTQCVREGSTPATRARTGRLGRTNWTDLDRVGRYLREQGAREDEVCVLNTSLLAVYNDRSLWPSSRYLFLNDNLKVFRSHRDSILSSLARSKQRFLVCDLNRGDQALVRQAIESGHAERLAFRAGDYAVFRVEGREMPEWLATHAIP